MKWPGSAHPEVDLALLEVLDVDKVDVGHGDGRVVLEWDG